MVKFIQYKMFISSVQKEFARDRIIIKDYLKNNPLLRRFFEPFIFEETPAVNRRVDEVYLGEVRPCSIYIGLFGFEYGKEDNDTFYEKSIGQLKG